MKSKLTADAQVTLLLCSHLAIPRAAGTKLQPLSPADWNQLAKKLVAKGLRPGRLLEMSRDQLQSELELQEEWADRLAALLLRGAQLAIEVERLSSLGIWTLTRADDAYPSPLKERLGAAAPPVLFGAGKPDLLNRGYLAVVGSRDIDEDAAQFARKIGGLCAHEERVLVSGGARGVDRLSMEGCLEAGGSVIGVLADNLERAVREPAFRNAIAAEQLVLVSAVNPKAPFSVASAMARNKLIYCLARYGLAVSASLEKGGTRTGALEVLKDRWVPLFVRGGETAPPGNHDLVKRGALAFPADPPADGLGAMLEREAEAWKSVPAPASRKALKPEKGSPAPDMDDLFPVVWPYIEQRLDKWPTAGELALHLQVQREQMAAWLERASTLGFVTRMPGTERFVPAGNEESEQPRFDFGSA